MHGGATHIDTFDPKPDAPAEFRGPFQPIRTSVNGIQVSELFPGLAQHMQHAAIIRGMSTGDAGHLGTRYQMHTGYRFNEPRVDGQPHPDMGAVVAKELGDPRGVAPNYVFLGAENGGVADVYGPGFLGREYGPLVVRDPDTGVENLQSTLNAEQFRDRVALLEQVQNRFAESYRLDEDAIQAHRINLNRAVGLMQSDVARAFTLGQEPAATASAYGTSRFGRQCLMARRLIEVGIPFVEVSYSSWDHHANLSTLMRRQGLATDAAMSALVADLKTRGLLDSTLIVWMGEFGRTPRLRGDGRDHYAQAWSTLLMGGGIRGGSVIGRTDHHGATVEERPVTAADFFATVYRILGIDPRREHRASGGRPIRIVRDGARPIDELIS